MSSSDPKLTLTVPGKTLTKTKSENLSKSPRSPRSSPRPSLKKDKKSEKEKSEKSEGKEKSERKERKEKKERKERKEKEKSPRHGKDKSPKKSSSRSSLSSNSSQSSSTTSPRPPPTNITNSSLGTSTRNFKLSSFRTPSASSLTSLLQRKDSDSKEEPVSIPKIEQEEIDPETESVVGDTETVGSVEEQETPRQSIDSQILEEEDPKIPKKSELEEEAKAMYDRLVLEKQIQVNPLTSIIETEHLGTEIKGIFEKGKEVPTIKLLENFISEKEVEIEEICNYHYQEFLSSVDELLTMRKDVLNLRESVLMSNRILQNSGNIVLEKAKTLQSKRVIKQNIIEQIEVINTCLFILGLCKRINDYVEQGKVFLALKVLNQVQHNHLKRVSDFAWARFFESRIPILKETIKKKVLKGFNAWLVSIRDKSVQIGRVATEQMKAELIREEELLYTIREDDGSRKRASSLVHENLPLYTSVSGSSSPMQGLRASFLSSKAVLNSKVSGPTKDDISEVGLFDEVNVSFTPFYQCLYIHENLGCLDEFQSYYVDNRRLQCNLGLNQVAEPGINEQFYQYFYQLGGFFIVEDSVFQTTSNFIPRSITTSLWEMAMAKMKAILLEQFSYCTNPRQIVEVKNFLYLFCLTLSSFSYDCAPLYSFLSTIKEHYASVAFDQCSQELSKILRTDTFEPLKIQTVEQYKQLIIANDLPSSSQKVPQTFPFSPFVPSVLQSIRNFISEFYSFIKNVADSSLHEYIRRSTEQLLKGVISENLELLKNTIELSKIIQSSINLKYFLEPGCTIIENTLSSASGSRQRLSSRSMLSAAQTNSEKQIGILMEKTIDQYLEQLANRNWLPTAPSSRYDPNLDSIVKFLEKSFEQVAMLDQTVLKNTKSHIVISLGNKLTNVIMGDLVKKYNRNALQDFQRDIGFLESIINSHYSQPLNILAVPKQAVSLVLSTDSLEFLDEKIKKSKYPDLKLTPQLVSFLEKYVHSEASGFGSLFSSFTGRPAVRPDIEELIKRLSEKL